MSTEHRVTRTDVPPGDWATHPKGAPVLETLEKHASLTLAALRQRVPHATLALVRRLERDGLVRLDSGTSAPRVAIRYEKAVRPAPAFATAAALHDVRVQVRGAKQQAILDALAELEAEG